MKSFVGWVVSAGLVFGAAAASAQALPPYDLGGRPYPASDFDAPYAAAPPEAGPRYAVPEDPRYLPDEGPRYGGPRYYEPATISSLEVYRILRENGFSPLGIPRQRGLVYTISAINRDGDDGRLVIDARSGRILRFMPAYRMSDGIGSQMRVAYGPAGPLPPIGDASRTSRPPVAVPRIASRTPDVPLPKPAPHAVDGPKPLAAKPAPAPAQQSAAVQARPAETPAVAAVEAKPTPIIQPTQPMPAAQGLD